MVRNENESYLSYAKRLTNALECKMIDYKQWGDSLLGEENVYSDDNLRKSFYVVSKILANVDDLMDFTSDDLLKEIQIQKDELYKEKIKLQDQRREKNKVLREEARFENLKDLMLDKVVTKPQMAFNKELSVDTNYEGVLLCSDWHAGLIIDNSQNYFDNVVLKERVEELTMKAIRYCQLHKVKKLNVLLAGDFISGVIQQTARVEQEEDCIEQLMNVTDLIAEMLNKLKENIEEVVAYSCWGNHDRVIADKRNSLNRENLARLIPYYLRKTVKNVKIIDSHSEDFIEFNVRGKRCLVEHGDKTSVNAGLNNAVRLLGYVPDYIFLGHTHAYKDIDDCDTQITVNGSLCGSDDYAISLRKNTKPCQILKVFGEDVCTYKLELK